MFTLHYFLLFALLVYTYQQEVNKKDVIIRIVVTIHNEKTNLLLSKKCC